MDRDADRVDPDWPGILAGALKAYVVSASASPGGPDPDLVKWLSSSISAARTRAADELVRELRAEVEEIAVGAAPEEEVDFEA